MKIYAITDDDWSPKNLMDMIHKYSNNLEFVLEPENAAIIWIFSYYKSIEQVSTVRRDLPDTLFGKQKYEKRKEFQDKLFFTSIHHLYRPKESYFSEHVNQVDQVCDFIQLFSEVNVHQTRQYFSKPMLLLSYWIDLKQFFPLPKTEKVELRRKYKLPLDKVIIGSFQRDTERDLKSPKLEKGPDIFCDILEQLDKAKHFVLLSGPRRNYVIHRLKTAGILFQYVGIVPFSELNGLYNALDYYLVTSRCEGGPQAILEAMATKTPIYSTPVGIANILSPKVVFTGAQRFVTALRKKYPDVLSQHYDTVLDFDVLKVMGRFGQAVSKIYKAYRKDRKRFPEKTSGLNWFYIK